MTKASIMVVEDDGNMRDVICRVVEEFGCVAFGTYNYEQAMALATTHAIDVTITDWDLKEEKSGVHIGRDLQKNNPALVLVFITAKPAQKLKQITEDLVVYRVLEKPVSLATLRGLVKDVLMITDQAV